MTVVNELDWDDFHLGQWIYRFYFAFSSYSKVFCFLERILMEHTVQFQLLEPKAKKSNYWKRFLGFLGQGAKTIIGTFYNFWKVT